jgi:hypothetical protein
MKQETINIIKSMTEKGFLVIVDPEKLKGEGAVMIEVMNWKENNNGVEISSTADNDEVSGIIDAINTNVSHINDATHYVMPGCKKEEQKHEIDLLQCDGRRFRAKICGIKCEGEIKVLEEINYGVYLCQNVKGAWREVVSEPYTGSWFMALNRSIDDSVTDFELLPEPRVIFTNCVGEVFTDEDVENRIEVWWASFNPLIIRSKNINYIYVYDASKSSTTDIFRSKKSLLKYLYETCD